jgi:hypothetical protein
MAATPGIGSLGSPEFFIPFDVNPAPGRQVANAPVRQYFNPGATAVMNILVFSTSGTCSFSMSGYFLLQ